ncbi:hypothetical protein AX774_g8018 [Zancudomyces culisetae]|uniref:Uncharacterized protein n=1 Tax=Zancudomyces culisetae TaxID=1213189 RepID=A0A1R1PC94_ZANCU|nr:hypothetical protein AX774_g8018 [Zancudomyces culisetae]|eukprot:OMH78580.1 hypothetical protein AX774_g8018 [Zancudomyces culisetae]
MTPKRRTKAASGISERIVWLQSPPEELIRRIETRPAIGGRVKPLVGKSARDTSPEEAAKKITQKLMFARKSAKLESNSDDIEDLCSSANRDGDLSDKMPNKNWSKNIEFGLENFERNFGMEIEFNDIFSSKERQNKRILPHISTHSEVEKNNAKASMKEIILDSFSELVENKEKILKEKRVDRKDVSKNNELSRVVGEESREEQPSDVFSSVEIRKPHLQRDIEVLDSTEFDGEFDGEFDDSLMEDLDYDALEKDAIAKTQKMPQEGNDKCKNKSESDRESASGSGNEHGREEEDEDFDMSVDYMDIEGLEEKLQELEKQGQTKGGYVQPQDTNNGQTGAINTVEGRLDGLSIIGEGQKRESTVGEDEQRELELLQL